MMLTGMLITPRPINLLAKIKSMEQSYKICPRCGQTASLQASVCQKCGRQYRTQFVPFDQTTVIPQNNVSPKRSNVNLPIVVGVAGVFLVLSVFAVYSWRSTYPFIGQWYRGGWSISEEGITDVPTTIIFYRNGTGVITRPHYGGNYYSSVIETEKSPFRWHVMGNEIMTEGDYSRQAEWTVSSDGEIFKFDRDEYRRGVAIPPPNTDEIERIKSELRTKNARSRGDFR